MNKKLLVISALMCSSVLAGCGQENKEPEQKEEPVITDSKIKELVSVDIRGTFQDYLENIKSKGEDAYLAEFVNKQNPYLVGTTNSFKLSPTLTYFDKEDNIVTDDYDNPEQWDKGWKLELKEGNTSVDPSKYEFSKTKCELKLSNDLIGKTLTSIVTPEADESKGLKAEDIDESYQQTFTFKVTEGYNVYKAVELNYFDDRDEAINEHYGQGVDDWDYPVTKMKAFKEEKGLDKGLRPEKIILHDNLKLTKDDVHPDFIYKESEVFGDWKEKAKNTTKDYSFLFVHTGDNNIGFEGNYFMVDAQEFPLITRHRGKDELMGEGGAVSHAAIFKVVNGTAEFNNVNFVGNGGNYVKDGDSKNAGGEILIKSGIKAKEVKINNVLAKKCFITAFSEEVDEGLTPTKFVIKDSKFSDNYNSFLYNWGGEIEAANSYMGGCGGPVCIQDHTDVSTSGPWESQTGDVIYGHAPKTTFVDCTLNNYVHGGEAWFDQFGATALVPQIKQMSQLYALYGKSFVASKNQTTGEYSSVFYNPQDDSNMFFNFIALNKSSAAQGMTLYPVCGEVSFINNKDVDSTPVTETTTFNYLKADKVENYVSHMALRAINAGGGPVLETAGGVGAFMGGQAIEPINSVNEQLGQLYDLAAQVYTALQELDKLGLTEEERTLKILNDNDFLRATLVKLAALQQSIPEAAIPQYETQLFVGAVFELVKDQARQQAIQGLIDAQMLPSGTTYDALPEQNQQSIDAGIMENLGTSAGEGLINADVIAATNIYPIFRPIIIVANMLKTGKVYTQELGLVSVVDIYRGMMGYGAEREVTISEAISGIYSSKYHHETQTGFAWDKYLPMDILDWSQVLNIAEIANKYELDPQMTVARALGIAAGMTGQEASNAHFGDKATEYTAIYFNGMMLVMGLSDLKLI